MLDELIRRVILPYTILGFLLLLAGVGIRYSILPELDTDHETAVVKVEEEQRSRKRLIDFPYLVLGAIAIFLHVGTQVVAIDTIINYAGSMGIGLLDAKVFPSYTLTATIIGYVLGIMLIPRVISQRTALVCCTSLGLLLSLGVIFADGA